MHAGSSPHFNNTDASSRTSFSTGGLRRVRRAAPVATHGLSGSSGVPDFPSLSVRRLSAASMVRRGRTASWEHRIRSTEYGARCSQFICHLGTKWTARLHPFPQDDARHFHQQAFFGTKGKKKRIVQSALQHRHMVKPFIFASEANIELKLVGGSCWPPHSPTSWSRHNEASKVAMHPRRFVQCTLPCKAATRTVSKT